MEACDGSWSDVFDEIKAKEGLTSDAQLAAALNVTRGFICSVRKKRRGVSKELGQKLYARLDRPISSQDLGLFMPARVQLMEKTGRPDAQTRASVFSRANGNCELCMAPAPFLTPKGLPYLELHHIIPILLGGKSSVENIVALCPNCHKKMEIVPGKNDIKVLAKRTGLTMNEPDVTEFLCNP